MAELANAYITITPRVDFAPVADMLRELADRLDEMQERALSGGAQGIMPLTCNLGACDQDVKE